MTLVGEEFEYGPIKKFSVDLPLWLDEKTRYQAFVHRVQKYGHCKSQGTREFLPDGKRGKYIWDDGYTVLNKIKKLSLGLQTLGLKKGDRVGIDSKTRAEWTIADMACSSLGYVVVPIYESYGPDKCEYIINSTQQVLIFATSESTPFIKTALDHCPTVKHVVYIDATPPDFAYLESVGGNNPDARKDLKNLGFDYLYSELMDTGARLLRENPNRLVGDPTAKWDDVGTIVFTSGTVGTPKGAVLTENGLLKGGWCLIARLANYHEYDTLISYLPIAHIFQRALEIFGLTVPFGLGYFSGSIKGLVDDVHELRPTCFPVVPRVLSKIFNAIQDNLKKKSWLAQQAFKAALWMRRQQIRYDLPIKFITDRVFKPIHEMLGGRVRMTFCGSAPLSREVGEFLDLVLTGRVLEGYGQTEACGASFSMIHVDHEFGSVALPCAGLEVCLRSVPEMGYYCNGTPPRGELCMRGPPVFMCYWNEEQLTHDTLRNGWLHTGDVGEWTPDGRLRIIDRLKNVFKLQQGEFVFLDDIENSLSSATLVKQIMMHGDPSMSALVAIVVPETHEFFQWAKDNGHDDLLPPEGADAAATQAALTSLCALPDANKMMLDYLNTKLRAANRKGYEVPRAVYLTPIEFSIENNQMTPTMKVRREQIRQDYKQQIERMAAPFR